MLRKMVLLLVIMLFGSRLLYCYDPVDTVWSINDLQYGLDSYDVSPNENYLVILKDLAGKPFYPKLYNAKNGSYIKELDQFKKEWYTGCKFSPNSRYLAISGKGNNVLIWDIDSNRIDRIFVYDSNTKLTSNIKFSTTGDTIFFININSINTDSSHFVLMNFNTGEIIKVIDYNFGLYNLPQNLLISPSGNRIAIITWFFSLYLILNVNLDYFKEIDIACNIFNLSDFSSDGSKILCSEDDSVIIRNSDNGIKVKSISLDSFFSNKAFPVESIFCKNENFIISYVNYGDQYGLYLYNINEAYLFKKYRIAGEKLKLSKDENYLYYTDYFRVNKIRLDWPVGVPQPNYNLNIKPNPAGDYIEIEKPSEGWQPSEGSNIRIYNSIGECVMTSIHPMTASHRMNVENLTPGIYILRFGTQTMKFVKM